MVLALVGRLHQVVSVGGGGEFGSLAGLGHVTVPGVEEVDLAKDVSRVHPVEVCKVYWLLVLVFTPSMMSISPP